MAQLQKLDELAMSPHWRAVAPRLRRLLAELPIMPPVLAIGVALGLSCLASGHPLAGLWVTSASLSWAFLIGAANTSQHCSGASAAEDEAPIDASVDDDHAKGKATLPCNGEIFRKTSNVLPLPRWLRGRRGFRSKPQENPGVRESLLGRAKQRTPQRGA